MITAYGAIDLAVTSLKQGTADFVVKPWQNEQLIGIVTGLLSTKERKKTSEHSPVIFRPATPGPNCSLYGVPLMKSMAFSKK